MLTKRSAPNNRVDDLFEKIKEFRVQSNFDTIVDILRLIQGERSSFPMIADKIREDPGLVIHVLNLANMGNLSLAGGVSDLESAIRILGFDRLKSALALASVTFGSEEDPFIEYVLYRSRLVSLVCRTIAGYLETVNGSEVEIAGLLLDLGKIFLYRHYPEFSNILIQMGDSPHSKPDYEAEKEVYGFDHSFLGYQLASLFRLPSVILDPILNHHHPERSTKHPEISNIVALSDRIASGYGFGNLEHFFVGRDLPRILAYLGIRDKDLDAILEACVTVFLTLQSDVGLETLASDDPGTTLAGPGRRQD